MNRKGAKECVRCHVPFYSVVTSAAPSQIFCPHCGFLNDGENAQCVQCDATIRSTLAKLGTDLRDSTNFIARDMGVNIHVKCPGCATVCFVPPATACLRCGTCHTYFASPSVGDATNFHVARLASSISSSFMGLFAQKQRAADAAQDEAPEGKLIALGDKLPRSPLRAGRTRSNSASFRSSSSSSTSSSSTSSSTDAPLTRREQRALEETERAQAFARQEQALENMHTASYAQPAVATPVADSPMAATALPPSATAVTAPRSRRSSSRAAPLAQPVAPQDLVKVEGEIVEL